MTQYTAPLSKEERNTLACATVSAIEEVYFAEGEEGDFDDARRYYKYDAEDEELIADHAKWTAARDKLERNEA